MSLPVEPAVSAAWVRLLLEALGSAGFDATRHCERAGWDVARLDAAGARLPWSALVALWEEAARDTGDPTLGLRAARSLAFRAQGPLGYLVLSSPTLIDSLSLVARYQALHFDAEVLAVEDRGEQSAVVLRFPEAPPALPHQVEYVFAMLVRICGWVAGPAFRASRVRFRHAAPASAAAHRRLFGCPVDFGQTEHAILINRRVLALPSLYANTAVLGTVQVIAEQRLADLRTRPWVARVNGVLDGDLGASIALVARHLGVSRRHLQRKLAAEGETFERLLDDGRRRRALGLVRREGLSSSAIASQVGFTDARAFARAFRRWTGTTPAKYRAQASAARVEVAADSGAGPRAGDIEGRADPPARAP